MALDTFLPGNKQPRPRHGYRIGRQALRQQQLFCRCGSLGRI